MLDFIDDFRNTAALVLVKHHAMQIAQNPTAVVCHGILELAILVCERIAANLQHEHVDLDQRLKEFSALQWRTLLMCSSALACNQPIPTAEQVVDGMM